MDEPGQNTSDKELLNAVIRKWNQLHDPAQIPELLYHYTTFDGLQGILKENALRATYSRSLNDGSEWEFGKSVVSKYPIPEQAKRDPLPPPTWRSPSPRAMFVTCFCEDPNLLSMWRSYTNQGGGYCLGFEGRQLDRLQPDELKVGSYAARLVKMYYGDTPPAHMQEVLDCGSHVTANWVLENMIKHHGFQEEREWRVIVPDPPTSLMSFHAAHASIKASVQVGNRHGKLPLTKIVYGPTLRDDAALRQMLTWVLDKHGYHNVVLEASEIPYRL